MIFKERADFKIKLLQRRRGNKEWEQENDRQWILKGEAKRASKKCKRGGIAAPLYADVISRQEYASMRDDRWR